MNYAMVCLIDVIHSSSLGGSAALTVLVTVGTGVVRAVLAHACFKTFLEAA